MKLDRINWLLAAIIALGLALRLWNIDWSLPFITHPDEPLSVNGAIRMLRTGDLDPHNYHWGSLIFYLNALVYGIYFLFGKLAGVFAGPSDLLYLDVENIAVGYAPMPVLMILARALVAIGGAVSVGLIYLIGRDMQDRAAGLAAALLLAVSPTSVALSHVVKSDTFLVLFSLVSVLGAVRVLRDPRRGNYILAGIGIGLAVASKYNAVLIALPVVVAHGLVFGWRGFRRREIFLAALAAVAAFLVAMPFALLDFPAFWSGLTYDLLHYAGGHTGAEGSSFAWYSVFVWGEYGVLALLALAGLFALLRSRPAMVLAAFPVAYFAFVSLFAVHFETTILPIAPFILLFAAALLRRVYDWVIPLIRLPHPSASLLSAALVVLVALPSFSRTAQNDVNLARPDAREKARVWIDANLPRGARVALEPYAPYVNHDKFTVAGFEEITAHPPEWYEQNGFEYVVFSYGSFGRFYENPTLYPEYVQQYNAFFQHYSLVADFENQVRVYQTNATGLPAVRATARWGIFAPWLELVGYDWSAPELQLWWRGLEARRERVTLTLRLVDGDNQEIARSAGDLSEGISTDRLTQVARTLPMPPSPGLYRVEVDVDALGQGRVPVLGPDNAPVSDKYFLGPVKFPPSRPTADELSRLQPVNAHFGDAITLLGYVSPPGQLMLYWQSTQRVEKDYTVFVHLLDATGRVSAQVDGAPSGGRYPTSIWEPGEIVRDEHALFDLAPGKNILELGMYEYPSLSRLSVADASGKTLGDHIDLEVVVP